MSFRNFLVIFSCLTLVFSSNKLLGEEKKPVTPVVGALTFSSEQKFVDWLANVQFIQKDKSIIYYHKGFRFMLLPDGKILRTAASLDNQKGTITWISKNSEGSDEITTLTIVAEGSAQLTKKGEPTLLLTIRSRKG